MRSSKHTTERQPSERATLYCRNCNRSGRINGDWILEVHADHLGYECPDCGTIIDSRRDESALNSQSSGALRFGRGQ